MGGCPQGPLDVWAWAEFLALVCKLSVLLPGGDDELTGWPCRERQTDRQTECVCVCECECVSVCVCVRVRG